MTTVHEAEAYLRNPQNPTNLYVQIHGKRRRLFINRHTTGEIGIIAEGKRNRGRLFFEWASIEKVFYPTPSEPEKENEKMVHKYQKLARLATFSNSWLKRIAQADPSKTLYDNGITTGTTIDGKCIKLSTIEKYCGSSDVQYFRQCLADKRTSHSVRFDFQGYDGSLWTGVDKDGNPTAGFCKEYRGCGNGYYYLLINDDTFIGYDID